MANVLVACEFSGRVRDAFARLGHNAWSADLLPSETPGQHYVGDAMDLIEANPWDLMIAHPPCTHLAVSGARWFAEKRQEQAEALEFVRRLLDAPIPRIALENPISVISSRITGRDPRVHREPPSPDRWKNRSRTFPGIARAMASQWAPLLP